jgi:hypothetical protein
VHLARDEEINADDADADDDDDTDRDKAPPPAVRVPPPAYGLWRSSVVSFVFLYVPTPRGRTLLTRNSVSCTEGESGAAFLAAGRRTGGAANHGGKQQRQWQWQWQWQREQQRGVGRGRPTAAELHQRRRRIVCGGR